MAIDLADYETKTRGAIQAFWSNREKVRQKQLEAGTVDQGERAGVTAGKTMDGFVALVIDLVRANGLAHAGIHRKRSLVVLPGYFRATKTRDLLVLHEERLIAAIKLKRHVGPSFSNNFNNRAEEAIGMAHDFWTAYREKAFGDQPRPFVGWQMLVEDAPKSRTPVRDKSPYFPTFPEFQGASCLKQYDLLCQRLVLEELYTAASVIASPRSAATGAFVEISAMAGLRAFVASLAGHIATEAARIGTT